MDIIKKNGWVYYITENVKFDKQKVGKWMYFFSDVEYAKKMCESAVIKGVVEEAKHTDGDTGVACFYINYDDILAHKRIIEYFLENNLIQKTKTGKLYNISFKFDIQTRAGEYGNNFYSEIKLAQFVDLNTGEWIYHKN